MIDLTDEETRHVFNWLVDNWEYLTPVQRTIFRPLLHAIDESRQGGDLIQQDRHAQMIEDRHP